MHRTEARRTSRLRQLLLQPELSFLMEAHNGLSAKVAEEAGFDGIWAQRAHDLGVVRRARQQRVVAGPRSSTRPSSWRTRPPCRSSSTAIRATATSTTYAGWCASSSRSASPASAIEDKQFPEDELLSPLASAQPLADMDEFCGKIRAGKDSQQDDDFVDRRARRGADRRLGHGGSAAALPRRTARPAPTRS